MKTMKLTTEQKLERCIEFIKKIKNIDIPLIDIEDLVSIDAECEDCGSDEIHVEFENGSEVVDPKFVEDLKDEAWHLLADITD